LYDQSQKSGKYCVQFVTFKNTETSLKLLHDWRQDCLDWCFNRYEDGKFGDQLYLDYWSLQYPKLIHEEQNRGIGLAPWNCQVANIYEENNILKIKIDNKEFQVVFYHFHGLKIFSDSTYNVGDYFISPRIRFYIYAPYIQETISHIEHYNLSQWQLDWYVGKNSKVSMRFIKQKLRIALHGIMILLRTFT